MLRTASRMRTCRFSNLDFLKFAWGAQMINQFEGSKAIALDFQTVRGPCMHALCAVHGQRLQSRAYRAWTSRLQVELRPRVLGASCAHAVAGACM